MMSNPRNSTKATACAAKEAGDSHNTSQKASISSHTMPPWSETPMARPVLSQATQPSTNAETSTAAITLSLRRSKASTHTSHANKVPQVPGAGRRSPLPNPKAIMRQMFWNTQRTGGWTEADEFFFIFLPYISAEMVKAAVTVWPERRGTGEHINPSTGTNAPNDLSSDLMLVCQLLDEAASSRSGREIELIDITAV